MSTIIEELIAKIGADTSGFDSGIKSVTSSLSNFMGIAGGLSVVGIFSAAIKEAAGSEEAVSALNNVLKSTKGIAGVTANQATALATSLQKVTRYSDEDVLAVQTMLLRYTKLGKDIFPKVTEQALDVATALGIDATSAAKMLGKAYQEPVDGATALTKAGVKLSDQTVRQIQYLARSGQTLKAQKMLLDQVAIATGGAARAAGETFTGSIDILKNSISDLFENIGGALLPVFTPLVQDFSSAAQSIAPLVAQFAPLIVGIGAVVLALSPLGAAVIAIAAPIAGIVAAVALLKSAWDNDFMGMRTTIGALFTAIKPDIDKIISAVQGMIALLSDPFGGISKRTVMAEVKLARAGGEDPSALLQGFDIGERIASAIAQAGPKIAAAASQLGKDLAKAIGEGVTPGDFSGLGVKAAQQLSNEMKTSASMDNPVQFALRNWIEGVAMDKTTGQNLWNFIPEPDLGAKISSAASNAIISIQNSQPVKDLANALDAILNTKFDLVGGLSASINDVLTWITSGEGAKSLTAVGSALATGITGALVSVAAKIKTAVVQGLKDIVGILRAMGSFPFIGPQAVAVAAMLENAIGKAAGGAVSGGHPYLVGERGPELFMPGQSGSIVPNGALAGGGGLTIGVVNVYGVENPAAFYDKMKAEAQRRNVQVKL